MDEQIDIACLTLNVTSPMDASDSESGAVYIQGGMGVAQNVYVGKTLMSNGLSSETLQVNDATCKKATIDNLDCKEVKGENITSDTLLSNDVRSKKIECDVLQFNTIDGVFDKFLPELRCSKLESHTINVMNDCAIGSLPIPCKCTNEARCDCPGVPMFETSKSHSSIEFNCKSLSIFNNASIVDTCDARELQREPVVVIDDGIEFFQPLTFTTLLGTQQIIKSSSIQGDVLSLEAHVTFLCLDCKDECVKKLSTTYRDGTIRKIVLRKTKEDRSFVLHINEGKSYRFSQEDDFIEVMFDKVKWNFISGNIRTSSSLTS